MYQGVAYFKIKDKFKTKYNVKVIRLFVTRMGYFNNVLSHLLYILLYIGWGIDFMHISAELIEW